VERAAPPPQQVSRMWRAGPFIVDLSLVVKGVFEKIPERDHVFAIVAISLLPAQKQYLNIIVRSWSCRKGPCKFIVEVVFEFL